jgi:hypothetical protein
MNKLLSFTFLMFFSLAAAPIVIRANDTIKMQKADTVTNDRLSAKQVYDLEMAKIENKGNGFFSKEETVIPIAFFTFVIAIIGLVLYFRNQNNKKLFEVYLKYAEIGKDIPAELLSPKKRKRSNLFLGVIILSVGIGLMSLIIMGNPAWIFGLIPFFVGLGYITVYIIEKKSAKNDEPA